VPDVIGVLLPRFCVLDPEAGGAGRWPGAWPFPGAGDGEQHRAKGSGLESHAPGYGAHLPPAQSA
jgi:hypothetical protein